MRSVVISYAICNKEKKLELTVRQNARIYLERGLKSGPSG